MSHPGGLPARFQQLPIQQLPIQQLPIQQLPIQQLPIEQLRAFDPEVAQYPTCCRRGHGHAINPVWSATTPKPTTPTGEGVHSGYHAHDGSEEA